MADRVDIHCRFHEQYPYQLYCKDCRDFACLECLVKKHQKHTMCKFEDAVNEIRKEVQTFINDEHEGTPKMDHLEELLEQKESEIQNVESEITNKIEDAVEILKREIDFQKECLLTDLTKICYSRRQAINLLQTRVKNVAQNLANFNTNAMENNLYEMMHFLVEIKTCSQVMDKKDHMFNPPIFQENQCKCKIGYLRDGSRLCTDQANSKLNFVVEECQKDHVLSTSVGTQTEDDDTDSENDWFDAEDTNDVETSSDEIREEYPMTICFDKDSKVNKIIKIVPISNQDAWILSNGNLRKLTKLAIEDDIYAGSIDDFLLLKDGSILLLSKKDAFIKKLLQNKRVVRFADVLSCSYSDIDCFCEDKEGSICLIQRVFSMNARDHMHHLVKFNNLGMILSKKTFGVPYKDIPFRITNPVCSTDFFVVYHVYENKQTTSCIRKIKYSEEKITNTFSGAIGINPRKNFMCYGITCDDEDHVLVSDNIHHCIYALDHNLKFSKYIVGAEKGLQSPMAIALHDNMLWVADDHNIFIFDYKLLKKL